MAAQALQRGRGTCVPREARILCPNPLSRNVLLEFDKQRTWWGFFPQLSESICLKRLEQLP